MTIFKLQDSIEEIKGVGQKFLPKLKKLEIKIIKDLLWHFPFRYDDFSKISKIADVKINEPVVIQAIVKEIKIHRTWKRRMIIVDALIGDNTGNIGVVWFNQPFILNVLKKGTMANFAGKTVVSKNKIYLSNPVYEVIYTQTNTDYTQTDTEDGQYESALSPYESESLKHTGRLVPVYPETRGLTSKAIRFLIKPVLDNLEKLPELLPKEVIKENKFLEINQAIRYIHFPENFQQAQDAKKRFAFEDLFLLQLNNIKQRLSLSREKSFSFKVDIDYLKELISHLPFELTKAQKKTLWEILQDFQKSYPMNRLLQGDVGSGKTIVAGLAALMISKSSRFVLGKQSAFMAPTEILAQQHYKTFLKFFPDFKGGIGLITSGEARIFYGDGLEAKAKKNELVKKIISGEIKIIIGTHALIQKSVDFLDLAFVVVDEQHRFGISQRAKLAAQTNIDYTRTYTEENNSKDSELLYGDLTYKIRGAIFSVKKQLGLGHKESIYQKALEEEFKKLKLSFEKEKSISITYSGKKIGIYRPDFIVEDKIILEIKALPFIGRFEKNQIWHYLKGSNYELALLVNFGRDDIDIKRFIYNDGLYKSVSSPYKSVNMPHFLSMSATPIPRTLSLTVFGDLDLSIIDELPKGRKEIITKIVAPANRNKAYQFLRDQIRKGRQVFVICPRIDPSEMNTNPFIPDVRAVKEEYEKLSKKIFPDLNVAILHGKIKSKEKAETMKQFNNGAIDILVSTSVVEVGVDVPNASIMLIEGSERFGLAQLYQFRGRVGRGEYQSFCFLFTDSSSKATHQRLRSLIDAKNGFELAEKDLAIRGPGQILGADQTGVPDLAMKAIQNPELIKSARQSAELIIKKDSELKNHPFLKSRLENFQKEIHLE